MPMDSGEAIPLEMFKGEPIPLTSQDVVVSENESTFEVKKEEAKQEDSNK